MSEQAALRFEPPASGTWFLDPTHWTKPVTRFFAEIAPASMVQAFREGFRRYGVLLDYLDWGFVNGFPYWSPRPLGTPPGATGHPPREVWEDLMETDPQIQERLRTSETVFARKVWRDDLRLWDEEIKPAAVEAHRKLLAVDPSTLPPTALLAHLDACREHLRRNIHALHTLTMASIVPVGDLMVQGQEWTGRQAGELLSLLKGAAPTSRGPREELDRLVRAIAADRQARALLDRPDAADVLTSLRSLPGDAGAAASAYLDAVSYQPVNGHDVGEPCAIELPGLLVETIRGAVEGAAGVPDGARTADRIAGVRAEVGEQDRAAFDELVVEARLVCRVRDERYLLTTHWAEGIARRAILAAGDLLADKGELEDPKLLIEADYAEMRALLEGWEGPSSDELRGRARYRDESRFSDAPRVLGPPPGSPLPAEWLPPISARLQRAVLTAIDAVIGTPEPSSGTHTVRGLAAGEGVIEGPARLVLGTDDFDRVRPGDVLVTPCTTPAFTVVLPLLAGIVTDTGGLLSHAAIVARELGIPAIVGCTDATSRIPDGAVVRVDAHAGEAVVLSRPQGS
jgi:phosphohistidine swiveling domain-containing protein